MSSLCFSPDGRYLIIGDESLEGHASYGYIWEVATKRVLARFKMCALSVDISPDGRLLVTALSNGSIVIRKMRDGSSKVLRTKDIDASCGAVKFSPNGRYVVASTTDQFLRVFSVRSGQLVGKWNSQQDYMWFVAFLPDGEELMSGGGGGVGSMKLWDVSSLRGTNGRVDKKNTLVPKKELRFEVGRLVMC
jgi:WD40 repeat protein